MNRENSLYFYIKATQVSVRGDVTSGLLAAFSILYSLPVVVMYSLAQRTLGNAFAMSGAVKG